MRDMAIVKASFTKSSGGAKASIRYIEHRPGKDHTKITRTLWGWDGKMERKEAYAMIDEARRGSYFFRFVISPDPVKEDTHKDMYLRDLTEQTMLGLEERLQRSIHFVAATHDDHAPHRHVHLVAIVPKKLQVQDLQAVREMATEAALDQRRQRDNIVEQSREKGKEQAWQRERERSK